MATEEAITKLDKTIAEKRRELDGLLALRELISKDPMFAGLLSAPENGNKVLEAGSAPPENHPPLDRISAFLQARNNRWASTAEITKGTGITLIATKRALRRAYKNHTVDKKSYPSDKRVKMWRLKKGGDE